MWPLCQVEALLGERRGREDSEILTLQMETGLSITHTHMRTQYDIVIHIQTSAPKLTMLTITRH